MPRHRTVPGKPILSLIALLLLLGPNGEAHRGRCHSRRMLKAHQSGRRDPQSQLSREEARQILKAAAGLSKEQWLDALGLPQMPESNQGDDWCGHLQDGFYADEHASPPCTGFFECRSRMVVGLLACPRGLEYSTPLATCVPPHQSSCAHMHEVHLADQDKHSLSNGTGTRRSALGMIRDAGAGEGLNYQAEEARLGQATALLSFKASVLDFNSMLKCWLPPPRPGGGPSGSAVNQQTGGQGQGQGQRRGNRPQCPDQGPTCASGMPCAGSKACWRHVTCSPNGTVTSLRIDSNRLSTPLGQNSIPPIFSKLTGLRELVLPGSDETPIFGLTGTLPLELSVLTALTLLDLSYNHITGEIGASGVPWLTSISELYLHSNWLTGEIPNSLSNLRKLSVLKLWNNGLSGSIPAALGSLPSISTMMLGFNRLTGTIPASLGNLPQLMDLQLNKNNLEGPIPQSFSGLISLEYLSLEINRLSGAVPQALSSLTNLYGITLARNQLGGPLPLRTFCHPGLSTLSLGENNFTGGLSANDLAECGETIQSVNISSNSLSGPIPDALFSFISAEYFTFDAARNSFSGTIPQSLATIPAFTGPKSGGNVLDLSGNQLTGEIPPNFPCMGTIYLFDNQLTGALPAGIFCNKLLFLSVSNNLLSGQPAEAFAAAPPGCQPSEITMSNNRFSGPLPTLKGNRCSSLSNFNASGNQFEGGLSDLSACSSLASLDVSSAGLGGFLNASLLPRTSLVIVRASNNRFSGPMDTAFSRLLGLKELDLSGNMLSEGLPRNLTVLQQLTLLDLSNNSLNSTLPPDIGNLTNLAWLDLSDNNISGRIPDTLAPPGMQNLTFLDLSGNNFTGNIPYGFGNVSKKVTLSFASNALCGAVPPGQLTNSSSFNSSVFADNQCLCDGPGLPSCPQQETEDSWSSLSTGALIGIIVGAAAGLILILGFLWFFLFARGRKSVWDGGTMLVFEKLDVPLTIYHILESTNNFDEEYMLGRGGFGSVYRGTLGDGRTVAIKRLAAGSGQGQKEFQAEMQTLGNIRHRNLVILVAAYVTRPPNTEKLLIYEFLSGGSLDRMLVKDIPKDSPFRQWAVRRRIIEDVARGLKYLHHDCTPRIVHRDMKPANVLLDDNMAARVADFGLAREFDMTKSHVSTSVFGTIGYLAPEYTTRGRLSFKSDVFAFGVVLLQVVTGKQPTDTEVAERGLPRWVGASSAASVCDPRLEDVEGHLNEIMGVITLGLRCTARVPSDRPSMEEVVYSFDHLNDFAKGFGGKGKVKISQDGKGKDV